MNYITEQVAAFEHAFDYYLRAAALFEELEELEGLALCLLNMGGILFNRADYKGALEAYNRSIKAAQQVGAESIRAKCLLNTGRIFEHWGKPERAMHYYTTALKGFQQVFDKEGIALCAQNLELCAAKLKWLPVANKECSHT